MTRTPQAAHALRGYVSDDALRARVTSALERTAMRQDGLINWPPVAQPLPGRDAVRVQWCHGAPGIVATLGDLVPGRRARPASCVDVLTIVVANVKC